LLGINGSILAHCPSLNQNKFARICWPPIRLTNPLNLNMVNWVLTLADWPHLYVMSDPTFNAEVAISEQSQMVPHSE
jgi:hypothetical protein